MIPDYDSIMKAQDATVINKSEFYATGKGLPDHGVAMVERPYIVRNDELVIYGLILMFAMISVSLFQSKSLIMYRIKTFFTTKRVYSDENVNDNRSEVLNVFLASCIGACSQSIMFYYCLSLVYKFPQYLDKPYWMMGIAVLVLWSMVYVKAILYSLVNWVFFDAESCRRWNHGYFLLVILSSFAFYVLAVVSTFFQPSVKIVTSCGLFVYILNEILLLYKLLVNFRIKKYGTLLIFLYFCSVEILPLMLLWHLLYWVFNSYFVNNLLT